MANSQWLIGFGFLDSNVQSKAIFCYQRWEQFMTNEQAIGAGVGIVLILCPFIMAFFIYKFIRANGLRKRAEKSLEEAHAKFERAQAMAEKTKSGYVYIISNIGSFGDDVVKIGLTRRLDPVDRVRELGDASVPFTFDTHAIIYSDDAPALERALHKEFEAVRINAQNFRKEFFRTHIEEVEAAVTRLAPGAPFFRDVEAQDYRETLARRNATLAALEVASDYRLPEAI